MAYRIFNSAEEAAEYAASLDARWPERSQIIDHIGDLLAAHTGDHARIVELCSGAGLLAENLVARLPIRHYTGFDVSALSLALARARLAAHNGKVTFVEADLNANAWHANLNFAPDAIVALQSVHDLGGAAEVSRIYTLAERLLAPGGVFVNADLLPQPEDELGRYPGRFTPDQHIVMLTAAGFAAADCTLQQGRFGCFLARKANVNNGD